MIATGSLLAREGHVRLMLAGPNLFFPAVEQAGFHPRRMIYCERDKEDDILAPGMQNSIGYSETDPHMNTRDPGHYAMFTTSFPSTLPTSINS